MAGATAATAAAATAVQANEVQITIVDNQMNTITGSTLDSNLAGTGNLFEQLDPGVLGGVLTTAGGHKGGDAGLSAIIDINHGFKAYATQNIGGIGVGSGKFRAEVTVNSTASPQHVFHSGSTPQTALLLVPITLTSSNVNGGAATNALIEVKAFNVNATTDDTVALTELIYDKGDPTASTLDLTIGLQGQITTIGSTDNGVYTPANGGPLQTPEPSSLALLALGAGGLLARRFRQKAA